MKQLLILAVAALVLAFYSHANAWTLHWTPPEVTEANGEVAGYIVEISEDGGETWPFLYNVEPSETPSLTLDDKAQYLQEYSFRVSAWNAAGVSEPSPAISWTRPGFAPPDTVGLPPVQTIEDDIPPAIPTGLVAE